MLSTFIKSLKQHKAPIVYIHPDEDGPPEWVAVSIEKWGEILETVPHKVVDNHSHMEPEDYEY